MKQRILFIDRDGTLIDEPLDQQVDAIEKITLKRNVIPVLRTLKTAGYRLVMVSNQDGLGTFFFPEQSFLMPHQFLLALLESQGIFFDDIRICPHLASEYCECRKPKMGLVLDYLREQTIDRDYSFVIGDRETDLEFAKNIGIQGILFQDNWDEVLNLIAQQSRTARVERKTNETEIEVYVDLSGQDRRCETGIQFFNHMLEQLASHAGITLHIEAQGDLEIDDHHTVEDTAIALGTALKKALGNKIGIARYGFVLPMDESLAHVAIDLSGRAFFSFKGEFSRERVGDFSTELVTHFFQSFSQGLQASIHIEITGENTHHMIEAIFKSVGRTLRQAIQLIDSSLPSTKGVL